VTDISEMSRVELAHLSYGELAVGILGRKMTGGWGEYSRLSLIRTGRSINIP